MNPIHRLNQAVETYRTMSQISRPNNPAPMGLLIAEVTTALKELKANATPHQLESACRHLKIGA